MRIGSKLPGHLLAPSKQHRHVQQAPTYTRHATKQRIDLLQPCAMPEHAAAAVESSADTQQQTRVKVRPLEQADKERWLVLFKDYIKWYKAEVCGQV